VRVSFNRDVTLEITRHVTRKDNTIEKKKRQFATCETSSGLGRVWSRKGSWGCYRGRSETNMADIVVEEVVTSKETEIILTEDDIPGAKLNKHVEECSCSVLRRWLLCRGAKTSGKLADLRKR